MNLERMTEHAGEWLRGTGPQSDIVVSSRVRLARNLAGYPFVNRAAARQRLEVLQKARENQGQQGGGMSLSYQSL